MATIRLPADFRDFLKLLNSHRVEYLLIGGYAVCFHGYYRTTADIDFGWACRQSGATRFGVGFFCASTQGSSEGATLGFVAESRWDSLEFGLGGSFDAEEEGGF